MHEGYKQQFVRLVSRAQDGEAIAPPDLKRRLAEVAAEQDSNMNEVALGILSRRYGVEVEPSGRRGGGKAGGNLLLRMPAELFEAVREAAFESRRTVPSEIIAALWAELSPSPTAA